MPAFILSFVVGVILVIIGISNRKGNISSLHSYHRYRVSQEDRLPFGKKVGLGTIICGCACIIFSLFSAIGLYYGEVFTVIGTAILIVGLVIGLIIMFRATIKYNKGIF